MLMIRHLLSDEVKEKVGEQKSTRALMDAIVRLQYNEEQFKKFYQDLKENRVSRNETIEKYYSRTLNMIKDANMCCKKPKKYHLGR